MNYKIKAILIIFSFFIIFFSACTSTGTSTGTSNSLEAKQDLEPSKSSINAEYSEKNSSQETQNKNNQVKNNYNKSPVNESSNTGIKEIIHMVNYVEIENFDLLAKLGINTVLIELEPNGEDWQLTYEAAIKHDLKIIPIIWDQDAEQSIWQWDEARNKWQLDREHYPESVGSLFLGFLKDNPMYLEQTFAIYSFHEPLWNPEKTGPERLKIFYRQITEEIFYDKNIRVYGEDITMGWEKSDECLTGVLDYESHNIYPFIDTSEGIYRPFDVANNYYSTPTNDLALTLQAEIACLDERINRYKSSPPAHTGRRPEPIILIQCFVDSEYTDLWNRMPSAEEMEVFATTFIEKHSDQIKGIGWYPYRKVADNYTACLYTDRYDKSNSDRLEAIRKISAKFFNYFYKHK